MRRTARGWPRALAVVLMVAAAGAGLSAACGGASGPAGLLEGSVTLGPIQPVEQAGGPPDSRPYAATVDITRPDGEVVATVRSGDDGRLSARLDAGRYRLVPRPPEGQPLPFAAPVDVTIVAGETTRVTIPYDTGIRLPD